MAKAEKVKSQDTADRIAESALTHAATNGWRNLAVADIAAGAGVSLSELAACYPGKHDILAGFESLIDRRMLAGAVGDFGDTPRDRLFAIIMERFDALTPFRDGVKRLTSDLPFDASGALILASCLPRSINWMCEAARISLGGPLMPLKLMALTGLYLAVFRTWLADDSPDLAKTMAALDRRMDQIAGLFGKEFASRATEPSASAEG
jgi:AcrR family transcriptional regulator